MRQAETFSATSNRRTVLRCGRHPAVVNSRGRPDGRAARRFVRRNLSRGYSAAAVEDASCDRI